MKMHLAQDEPAGADIVSSAGSNGDGAAVRASTGRGSRFPVRSGAAGAAMNRMRLAQPMGFPRYRIIVALDIEKSTTRTNPIKGALRQSVYDFLESALHSVGIDKRRRDPFVDRGDGVLALIHPADDAPKALVLAGVIPALNQLLTAYNSSDLVARQPQRLLRVRIVVHAGEIQYDANGCFGEDLDIAFRLLDAKQLKKALRRTTAPSVLTISNEIFRSVVRHGYGGIEEHEFRPIAGASIADQRHRAWIQLPEASTERSLVPAGPGPVRCASADVRKAATARPEGPVAQGLATPGAVPGASRSRAW
jgi:hypothetical protein